MTNLEWIQKGHTGCTFATLFSKKPRIVRWIFTDPVQWKRHMIEKKALIVSIEFSRNYTWQKVREWALENGFYVEETSKHSEGLRINCEQGKSWVQYFGPDSHVITRRTPGPMLMFTRKLNKSYYIKVGFKGILHLAHAFYDKIDEKVYDLLWERSYKQTCKKLGKKPGTKEAAKTTFLK